MKTCRECGKEWWRSQRGMCDACYARWKRTNPHLIVRRLPAIDAFWSHVDKDPAGCWEWTACLDHAGYGKANRIAQVGVTQKAHRISYTLLVGPIPDGLELDHLCLNRKCVRPSHLEPVTHAENHRRRVAAKTHCDRGHRYNDANTYYRANGTRQCRVCARDDMRRKRASEMAQ
jgi:hypothetical protein